MQAAAGVEKNIAAIALFCLPFVVLNEKKFEGITQK